MKFTQYLISFFNGALLSHTRLVVFRKNKTDKCLEFFYLYNIPSLIIAILIIIVYADGS